MLPKKLLFVCNHVFIDYIWINVHWSGFMFNVSSLLVWLQTERVSVKWCGYLLTLYLWIVWLKWVSMDVFIYVTQETIGWCFCMYMNKWARLQNKRPVCEVMLLFLDIIPKNTLGWVSVYVCIYRFDLRNHWLMSVYVHVFMDYTCINLN